YWGPCAGTTTSGCGPITGFGMSSHRRRHRLGRAREQAVPGEKLEHETIEQPRLLDLAGMAGAVENLHLATGNARLQGGGGGVRVVLAAAQDDGRAGDAGMVIVGIRLRQRLELIKNRLQVGVRIALGEHVGEEARYRRGAEGGAQILEGIAPAVVDAV